MNKFLVIQNLQVIEILKIIIDYNEESQNLTQKNKNKFSISFPNNTNKKIREINEIKNFPNYFFILFILVLFVLLFKFIPNFLRYSLDNPKLDYFTSNKNKMKYFSSFLSQLDIFSKVFYIRF